MIDDEMIDDQLIEDTEHRGMLGDLRVPVRRVSMLVAVAAMVVVGAALVGRQLHGPTSYDADISNWFLHRRNGTWNAVTNVVGQGASSTFVIGLCVVTIIVCAIRRRLDGVIVVVVAMIGEVVIFLSITALVDRARPAIVHLDPAPPTSSYPSGHTLATVVVWWSLSVLATRQGWASWARHALRGLAIVLPVAVAISRIYRGMHHPTDTAASLIIGAAWMTAVVLLIPSSVPGARPADGTGAEPGEGTEDTAEGRQRNGDRRLSAAEDEPFAVAGAASPLAAVWSSNDGRDRP